MDGIILVHKPKKLTSHDVVKQIRKIFGIKKVGHFGTLDPMATGLMLVGVGKATRLFPFFSKMDKVYQGQIKLGFSTDTYDATGKMVSSETTQYPSKKTLLTAMGKYEGDILQTPPPYSAKKYKGKPLYYLARKKKEFRASPTQIHVHYFRLSSFTPPYIEFEVKCSSGTYIRSIAHELGEDLNCGAHLSRLNRTEIGKYHLRDSYSLGKVLNFFEKQQWEKFFISIKLLLPEFPKVMLDTRGATHARHGNTIDPESVTKIHPPEHSLPDILPEQEQVFRIFSPDGQFIAMAKRIPNSSSFHPFLVLETEKPKDSNLNDYPT